MLSRLSFRAKLLLVLFVPFLALVVIAGAGLSDRFATLHAQEQFGGLEHPLTTLHNVSGALEREAVVNQWYVSTNHDGAVPIATARSDTDNAVQSFRVAEAQFRNADIGAAAATSLEKVDAGLVQLDAERQRIERTELDVVTPPLLLLAIDDNILEFGQEVARNLHDPETASSVTGVFALEQEQTQLAREAAALIPVLATGEQTGFSTWLRAIAAESRDRQQFLATASVADLAAFQSTVSQIESTPNLLRPSDPAESLPSAFPTAPNIDTPAHYFVAYEQQSRNLDHAIEAIDGSIASRSAAQAESARSDVWLYGGATVFAMLLTIALIWVVARAVIRPLRKLTESAREMSQKQLPQLVDSMRAGGEVDAVVLPSIEINSDDEIGELARAFNDIEAVTVQVARDQALLLRKGMGDLFVNLARRNQSLLERQLQLLDELERNENDPAALDALFKLDHMATRMRRNAESLLVLSGAEQPRQWQQAIGLLDVVRSASAEIADFPRVELVGVDDELAVSGRAVADLAHLVAELLENATSFSPPDAPVVVSGANTASGFVLAVSDRGIGMPPEKIAEANQLLAKPPVVGLALSRALGLHVVASLAARHHITVELRPGAPVGLVALVTLPSTILEREAIPAAAPPVLAPHAEPDGVSGKLSARRVAWRPPDEPPVEEWRAEGLADPEPAHAPTVTFPVVDIAPTPEPEPIVVESVSRAEDPPVEVPSAEEPRAENPFVEEPPIDSPTEEPPIEEPMADSPLPTRVPGHHLSHQPSVAGDEQVSEADPLRPYRVHELLTRHDLGKRRGRAEHDDPRDAHSSPTPTSPDRQWPDRYPEDER